MKTKSALPLLAFCLAANLTVQPQIQAGTGGNASLAEAVAKALAFDPTLRKVRADTHEAQGYWREVRADRLPQLSLNAAGGIAYRDRSIDGIATGGNTLFSRSATLIGRQLLADFGYSRLRHMDA